MMNSFSIMSVFVMILLLATGHSQIAVTKDCGPNEKYVDCEMHISCQPSCDQPNGTLCLLISFSEGCCCNDGFMRASDTNTTCIRKSQCDSTSKNQSKCAPNEIPLDCAPLQRCQPSCNKPNEIICPRICSINSCVCKKGFVRDDNNKMQCIEQTQCNISTNRSSWKCGSNEVAIRCAQFQSCQPSCDQPNGTACPLMCSRNPCVCKEGFIRDPNNNLTCIEKSMCREAEIIKPPMCDENEEYDRCANSYQPSCEASNRESYKTERCLEGCVCSKGYFRATNNMTSPCIKCSD